MALAVQRLRPVLPGLAVSGIGAGLLYTYFRRSAHADTGAPRKVFGTLPAFVSLSLESSESVSPDTKRLRFKLPNSDDVSGLSLTSAVLTLSWPKGRWLPVARPYTPISAINEPGVLELMVKKYPDGKQSTHLHSLQPGDKLNFVAAIPGHKWKPNSVPHVTLIAGGAGITPIYQLATGILGNKDDKTAITLLYGVNTEKDLLLRDEFDALTTQYGDRFNMVYTVSNTSENSPLRKGRVTKELIEEVTKSKDTSSNKVFVCGPPPMEASLVGSRKEKGILEQLGYRKDQIHTF